MSLKNFQDYLEKNNLDKKPHQQECVKWCLKKELFGNPCEGKIIKGGLIADEMGLGKTIQMIGTMVSNKIKTLIVVPRCLLEQWTKFIKETTDFSILIYHGKDREKYIENIKKYDVVLTTYNLIITTPKKREVILHNINWDRIIFDEAHHMRNSNTNIFKGAKKLKSNIRWLLTGTPIQNSKKDFYNLCEQIGIPNKYYTNPSNLYNIINIFVIKRTKQDIDLKLPNIYYNEISVDWESKEEKKLAEEIHSVLSFSNLKNSPLKIANQFGNSHLPLMVRAKQSCVYPSLLKKSINKIISSELFRDINKQEMLIKATNGKSKLNKVIEKLLEKKDNGNKKIVFCTFKAEIDYIENKLLEENINTKKFDGRINEQERIKILEDKEIDVLILQIQTGCEGLNLQIFNEIYFVSSHWNPSIEDQAIARAYRIGQTKEVYIYKFTMNSFDLDSKNITIEKHTKNVQTIKRDLSKIFVKE